MKNIIKKILTVLIIVLILCVGILLGIVTGHIPNFLHKEPTQVTSTTSVLKEAFKDTNELYVENYTYDMKSENTEPWTIHGVTITSEGNKLLYIFSGTLKVGVDMSKADINVHGDTISFVFPEWISLNDFADEIEIITARKLSLSTKDKLNWAQQFRKRDSAAVLKRAKENGTYEKAAESLQNNLQNQVNGILKIAGVEKHYEVEITIEDDSPVLTEVQSD